MQEEGDWKACGGSPWEGVVSEIPVWNLVLFLKKMFGKKRKNNKNSARIYICVYTHTHTHIYKMYVY